MASADIAVSCDTLVSCDTPLSYPAQLPRSGNQRVASKCPVFDVFKPLFSDEHLGSLENSLRIIILPISYLAITQCCTCISIPQYSRTVVLTTRLSSSSSITL